MMCMARQTFLADHFETPEQQYAAGKLGMWIFLLTEILLFGGLFCAYAVYRANHPEIFVYAHQFLDKNLGAINTAVLILSSLTMAWGVRCAQRDQQRGLVLCLVITLICACGFLGIKYVEYKAKWEHGLLWASRYKPAEAAADAQKAHPPDPGHPAADLANEPRNVGVFFSIYFLLTGLHAHPRAGRHGGHYLGSVTGAAGPFQQPLFRPGRLRRPLLAPGRHDLDLPVSTALLDSLIRESP